MNGYIICNNDSTEFIVIGTREQAESKLEEFRKQCWHRCLRDYGQDLGPQQFERYYWHIHDCDYEVLTPKGVAVQFELMDGEDDALLLERIRNNDHA